MYAPEHGDPYVFPTGVAEQEHVLSRYEADTGQGQLKFSIPVVRY